MDVEASGQKHLDPYEVHKENMQMLKVMPLPVNRSAPNSPMTRRAKDKDAPKAHFLSPSPQRKDLNKVTEDSRSKSLTLLTVGDGKSTSPAESPVGSPLSVSDRIIRTHYLSNTTGKPGSYLLKKSDEIVRKKESPSGSPKPGSSPNVEGKSPLIQRKTVPGDRNKDKQLSVPSPIPVVVSPATGSVTLGFKESEQEYPKKERKLAQKKAQDDGGSLDSDELEFLAQEEKHLESMRQSIGDALKPKPPPPPPPVETKKIEENKGKSAERVSKKRQKREKSRRHFYEKYGNTNKSPGFLTPPKEPRGSKDLSVEMAKWERKERKLFHDLDHVEEGSSIDPSEDEQSSEDEEDNEKLKDQRVFMMPPVFQNVEYKLESRDFSIPTEIPDGIDEEAWEEMKRCRYLRIDDKEEGEDQNEEDDEDLSDSDQDDMKTDDEDN